MPDQLAGGFNLGCALSQPKAHRLVIEDRLPEAHSVFGIRQRHLERAARHAQALRGNANASAFQTTERDFVAFTLLADQVLNRDAAVVKVDLCCIAAVLTQLVFQPRDVVARRAGRHNKGTHAALACSLVRHCNHNRHVTILTTGNELLDAIDHIAIAIFHRRRLERRGIRAHVRLGQTKRAKHLALRQRLQPFLLLSVIAKIQKDGVHRAIGHADGGAGAAITRRNFFQHQSQRDVIQIRTAKLFGHADAVSAQRGQAYMRFTREVMILIPARSMRPKLVFRELAHCIANHFLVGIENHFGSWQ